MWEMQIKTTMRYHFTPTMMAAIKKTDKKNTSVGKDVEKLKSSYAPSSTVKCAPTLGKFCSSPNKFNIELLYDSEIPLLEAYPK